jgi:hypothetical protein
MKQKIVGVYAAGNIQFQLVIKEGRGGECWLIPEPGSLPRIKIGVDQCWEFALTVLIHEVAESLRLLLGYRFSADSHYGEDLNHGTFIYTHSQFSDLCAREGMFLSEALPDFGKAYSKWRKENK